MRIGRILIILLVLIISVDGFADNDPFAEGKWINSEFNLSEIIGGVVLKTELHFSFSKEMNKRVSEAYAACIGVYEAFSIKILKFDYLLFFSIEQILTRNMKKNAKYMAKVLMLGPEIPIFEVDHNINLISKKSYDQTKIHIENLQDKSSVMAGGIALNYCRLLDQRNDHIMDVLVTKTIKIGRWEGEGIAEQ